MAEADREDRISLRNRHDEPYGQGRRSSTMAWIIP
jgi:hypothetical protein